MYGLPHSIHWQAVFVLLATITLLLSVSVFRRNSVALIAVIVLLLAFNYFLLEQYYYVRSILCVERHYGLRLTGKLMKELDNILEKEDLYSLKKQLANIDYSLQQVKIWLNRPYLSSDSAGREELASLIGRLDRIVDEAQKAVEQEGAEFSRRLAGKVCQAGLLLCDAAKGFGMGEGILKMPVTAVKIEKNDLEEFKALLGEMEQMLEIE